MKAVLSLVYLNEDEEGEDHLCSTRSFTTRTWTDAVVAASEEVKFFAKTTHLVSATLVRMNEVFEPVLLAKCFQPSEWV